MKTKTKRRKRSAWHTALKDAADARAETISENLDRAVMSCIDPREIVAAIVISRYFGLMTITRFLQLVLNINVAKSRYPHPQYIVYRNGEEVARVRSI